MATRAQMVPDLWSYSDVEAAGTLLVPATNVAVLKA